MAFASPTDASPLTSPVNCLTLPSNTTIIVGPSLSKVAKVLDVVLARSDDTPPSSVDKYIYKKRSKIREPATGSKFIGGSLSLQPMGEGRPAATN